jgi:hypothetical protein
MATEPLSEGIVYRRGQLKSRDFTPRPGKDTVGRPGQLPGLSTFRTPTPGKRVQKIDLARLRPPLRAFADDPAKGGTAGHVAILPVDDSGEVDQALLEEWAASRGSAETHPLTQFVLDTVVPQMEAGSS